jgi:hypothetical protein
MLLGILRQSEKKKRESRIWLPCFSSDIKKVAAEEASTNCPKK